MTPTATTEQLEARIAEALVEFGAPADEIKPEATWEELDVDSLDLVELAQIVEDEYGVALREADMDGMETVGDAIKVISAKLAEA